MSSPSYPKEVRILEDAPILLYYRGNIINESNQVLFATLPVLGYFSSLALEKMRLKEVYFISKIKSSTLLYSDNPELLHYRNGSRKYKENEPFLLDIKRIHSPLAEGENIEFSNILLGKTHKTPIRLIVSKLPEEVKAKRQMRREANAKKKKSKSS